jgi:hypothetical protein
VTERETLGTRLALLLHYTGEKVFFDTLTETGEDFDTAVRKLTAHFAPKKKYRLNLKLTAFVKFVKLQESQYTSCLDQYIFNITYENRPK